MVKQINEITILDKEANLGDLHQLSKEDQEFI
jgi:hypothetical protein